MQMRTVALASAIIAITGAIETHGGYQYEARFSPDATPETQNLKDPYETAAAKQAYARLKEQIEATGIASQCLTESEARSRQLSTRSRIASLQITRATSLLSFLKISRSQTPSGNKWFKSPPLIGPNGYLREL